MINIFELPIEYFFYRRFAHKTRKKKICSGVKPGGNKIYFTNFRVIERRKRFLKPLKEIYHF